MLFGPSCDVIAASQRCDVGRRSAVAAEVALLASGHYALVMVSGKVGKCRLIAAQEAFKKSHVETVLRLGKRLNSAVQSRLHHVRCLSPSKGSKDERGANASCPPVWISTTGQQRSLPLSS